MLKKIVDEFLHRQPRCDEGQRDYEINEIDEIYKPINFFVYFVNLVYFVICLYDSTSGKTECKRLLRASSSSQRNSIFAANTGSLDDLKISTGRLAASFSVVMMACAPAASAASTV